MGTTSPKFQATGELRLLVVIKCRQRLGWKGNVCNGPQLASINPSMAALVPGPCTWSSATHIIIVCRTHDYVQLQCSEVRLQ